MAHGLCLCFIRCKLSLSTDLHHAQTTLTLDALGAADANTEQLLFVSDRIAIGTHHDAIRQYLAVRRSFSS